VVQRTRCSAWLRQTCDPTQSTVHSGQRSQRKLSVSALRCLCKATLADNQLHKNSRYFSPICSVLLWMLYQLPRLTGIQSTAKSGRLPSSIICTETAKEFRRNVCLKTFLATHRPITLTLHGLCQQVQSACR
jgi:hypothetical protein